ncbi:MAG: YcbK family protein [Micavibrio sp.]
MLFDESSTAQSSALPTIQTTIDRRGLLKSGLIALGTGMASTIAAPAMAAMRMPTVGSYKISFRNSHTGESFTGVYRVGTKYLPDAFKQINHVLRDFRTGEEYPIDPRSIDILYMLQSKTGTKNQIEILSGYRSPRTNSMLRNASGGVARNSLHMVGQAIDLRMADFSTRRLRDVAIDLRAGGVGFYPGSNFVHVDSGKVRHW